MTVIEITPSRLLVILVVAVHVAAAFALLAGLREAWLAAAGVALLGASLLHFWRRRPNRGCRRIGLADDGGLIFDPDGRDALETGVRPSTVVVSGAVWLAWRDIAGTRQGVELILRDQLPAAEWRRLQVWVRLRARSSIAGPGQTRA